MIHTKATSVERHCEAPATAEEMMCRGNCVFSTEFDCLTSCKSHIPPVMTTQQKVRQASQTATQQLEFTPTCRPAGSCTRCSSKHSWNVVPPAVHPKQHSDLKALWPHTTGATHDLLYLFAQSPLCSFATKVTTPTA